MREHRIDDGSLERRSIFASFARWIERQLGRPTTEPVDVNRLISETCEMLPRDWPTIT
jgi:hypothetical protein